MQQIENVNNKQHITKAIFNAGFGVKLKQMNINKQCNGLKMKCNLIPHKT